MRHHEDCETEDIIEVLAHECIVLYLRQRRVGSHACDACQAKPDRQLHATATTTFYTVHCRNPLARDEFYTWGVLCWNCMASAVAEGAITQCHQEEGQLWQ